MYDPMLSYEDNYQKGPQPHLLPQGRFAKIKYTEHPRYSFLGVPLHIPFGVPAGPLLNSGYVRVALDAGFCLPVYKTVRSVFWKSNGWPNVLEISTSKTSLFSDQSETVIGHPLHVNEYLNSTKDLSISNSFGVPSQGPAVWSQDFVSCAEKNPQGMHVMLSFQPTHLKERSFEEDAEWVATLAGTAVRHAGTCLLEVNLSCPNEVAKPLYHDVKKSVQILKMIHQALSSFPEVKLIAKIGALEIDEAKCFFENAGPFLNGISAINTVSSQIIDSNGSAALGSGSLAGGVCGHLILEQSLVMVERLAQIREQLGLSKDRFGLIGVGGVSCAKHFQRHWDAGADVVQAATGMMWNLNLACEIAESLKVPYVEKTDDPS